MGPIDFSKPESVGGFCCKGLGSFFQSSQVICILKHCEETDGRLKMMKGKVVIDNS